MLGVPQGVWRRRKEGALRWTAATLHPTLLQRSTRSPKSICPQASRETTPLVGEVVRVLAALGLDGGQGPPFDRWWWYRGPQDFSFSGTHRRWIPLFHEYAGVRMSVFAPTRRVNSKSGKRIGRDAEEVAPCVEIVDRDAAATQNPQQRSSCAAII